MPRDATPPIVVAGLIEQLVNFGFWILGWEKSLLRDAEACNGDVSGRRPLPGGIALAQVRLPPSCSGETLGPTSGLGGGGM